jgi:hypothetical protein
MAYGMLSHVPSCKAMLWQEGNTAQQSRVLHAAQDCFCDMVGIWIVLENSNMAKLARNQYSLAQSRSKEGHYDSLPLRIRDGVMLFFDSCG